jgi:hypothetical protein
MNTKNIIPDDGMLRMLLSARTYHPKDECFFRSVCNLARDNEMVIDAVQHLEEKKYLKTQTLAEDIRSELSRTGSSTFSGCTCV